MKMKLLISILGLFFSLSTYAQSEIADSLLNLAQEVSSPEEKAELYIRLAEEQLGHSVDSSMNTIEKAIDISKGLKDKKTLGKSLIWKGRVLGEKNKVEAAIECFDEAESIFSQAKDSLHLAKIYNGKGIIYKYQNDYEKAIEYQYRSASLSEAIGMPQNAATTYNSIANIHIDLNEYPKAIEYYEKSVELLEKADNPRALAGVLINLAQVLDDDPEKKLKIYDRVEKLALENKYDRILAYLYSGLADYYEKTVVNVDSQKVYYKKAIDYAQRSGDPYMTAFNQMYLGILQAKDQPLEAERHILMSLENEYIQESNMLWAEGHLHLSKSLYKQGRFQEAYSRIDTALSYYQKVYDEEVSTKMSEANAKFETSQKEAQLAEQALEIAEQKNRQNRLLIGGLLLLALTAGIFQYFFYRQKRKKQAVEMALQNELAEAERLRQVDEIKTQFFTNVSHELRTPLSLIISPLEEVIKNLKQVDLEGDLKLAHRNSKQLLGLVNEVLDLSKLEAGKLEVEKTEIELLPFLKRVFYSYQSVADIKKVEMKFDSNLPTGLSAKTDISKLEKIINNLVSNALKFTPSGKGIYFKTELTNSENLSRLDIKVSDSGPGIPSEDLPHIFDRFFQSKTSGQSEGGTGIGLAVASQLADLLDGQLSAKSKIGEGSTFTLNIPIEIVEKGEFVKEINENEVSDIISNEKESLTAFSPLFINGQKPQLLIVEDNPEMSAYLKKSLSKNYNCHVALDGEAALEYLHQSNPPDLITSDVMMPNMDGFSFREKINEKEEWRQIPFILLTARTLEEDKLKGFQLGIDDYVTKPFSLPELEARIHSLLENKLSRENIEKEPEEVFSPNEQLVRDAENLVLENIDDTTFSVEIMAKKLGYSQRQMARIFSKQTGLTPVKFILEIRLQKARQLLEKRQFATVAEVRYEIGIESASYFTRKFTERFGKNPKEYLEVN